MQGIQMKADGDRSVAEVRIYDDISNSEYWGVSAKAFASEIAALDVDELNVFVNSPGGSAYDGLAIMNALRRHKASVHVTVDGLAASAASVIVMAGDTVTMNRGAELMIHEASSYGYGGADEFAKLSEALGKLCDSYADAYAARAGGDRALWRLAMAAETWYTAEEAVLAGLADEWVDAPAAEASFDLSKFKFQGRAQAPAPGKAPVALASGSRAAVAAIEKGADVAFMDEVRSRLDAPDASEADLLGMIEEAVTRPTAAAVPEGVQMVDKGVFSALQDDAKAGREALEQLAATRREGIVKAALSDGRIAAASAPVWLEQLAANEDGAKALLDSLPKNAVPMEEIGNSGVELSVDAAYAAAWGMKSEESI